MSYVEISGGVRLNYEDWGSGKTLVLIHGWPLDLQSWEYQMQELPKHGIRCIAYDRRGFGKSSKPWSGYNYDTLADDLAELLDKLNLADVTLAGFSMGGGEVVRYFSRHGGRRVAKAVLISSVAPYLMQSADNPDGVERAVFDQMIAQLQEDRPNFLTAFAKQFFGAGLINFSISSALLEWSRSLALQASPKATIDCVRAFSETDFRAEMGQIKTPTLVIHGDSDKTVPMKAAGQQAAAMIPKARFIVYEGAPHGLFYTEKARLNRDLADFVLDRRAIDPRVTVGADNFAGAEPRGLAVAG